MDLKIFWTDFSKQKLREIFKYLKKNASLRVAKNETRKITKATIRLKKQPEIGKVEQLLKNRPQEFRYLVHQAYKIIYWVNRIENRVEIVDVFHTRQYPKKIKRTK